MLVTADRHIPLHNLLTLVMSASAGIPQNHGMIDRRNNVEIVGVSEIGPTTLTAALTADATSISVAAAAPSTKL